MSRRSAPRRRERHSRRTEAEKLTQLTKLTGRQPSRPARGPEEAEAFLSRVIALFDGVEVEPREESNWIPIESVFPRLQDTGGES